VSLLNPTLADIEAAILVKKRKKLKFIFPDEGEFRRELYQKHLEFFSSGADFRVRIFRAANRVGKTISGSFETSCHLTGKYPHWWVGKRFDGPINALVAGESGKLVRDSIQLELCGAPNDYGTGMIPYADLIERRPKGGIADAIDTCRIRHVSGGESLLQFQSYDQGREAFQATSRSVIWLDEEPPLSVYSEALTRTMTTNGIVYLTFTPLKGVSETVLFLQEKAKEGHASLITATWDDVPHLSEKDKEEMLASYPLHQRDARTKGIPALGSGAIYPVSESEFVIRPITLPVHWRRGYALDVGWNRTAALFGAYDADADIVYFYSEHYRGQAEPSVHAEAIKARGEWMRGVIDPASHGRSQNDGEQLFNLYQKFGLHITNAKNGVESGIFDVYQRLSSGRIKVFSTLENFLKEYKLYRRDEKGKIIKENDHLLDCLRYYIVSGIEVSTHPPEWKDAIIGGKKSGHQSAYDPLSDQHISESM
jgi:phage terminase large subunit-like protein